MKRHKWNKPQENGQVKVGELVLVEDDNTKKKAWSLGRIVELTPSDDGVIRVAKVRTKDGLYTRPMTKIGQLEGN